MPKRTSLKRRDNKPALSRGLSLSLLDYNPRNQNEIFAWSSFTYNLIKRTGWLLRRVERKTYSGDARWERYISFDIDCRSLHALYQKHYVDQVKNPQETSCINLPLVDISKREQFTDFDVQDKLGRPINLLLRSQCVVNVMSALCGAIAEEHADEIKDSTSEFERLEEKDLLFEVIEALFKLSDLPKDVEGIAIEPHKKDCKKRLIKAIKKEIDDLQPPKNVDIKSNEYIDYHKNFCEYKAKAYRQLKVYSEKSKVFAYFLKTYTFNWLACIKVDISQIEDARFDNDIYSVIKFRFQTTMDIVGESKRETKNKWWPIAKGIPFTFELDGIGKGDVDHLVVEAPDGTFFSPSLKNKKTKTWERFIIYDKPDEDVLQSISRSEIDDEMQAWGTLTLRHVTLKANKTWSDDRSQLHRSVPVGDSFEHRYKLLLRIRPKLGLSAISFLAFFLLSALVFFMCSMDSTVYSTGSFSLNSLLSIAPIAIMLIVNLDEEPYTYIRRMSFWFPTLLSRICIVVDFIGFIWFFMANTQAITLGSECADQASTSIFLLWAPKVAWFGLGWCLVLVTVYLIWFGTHSHAKRKWSKESDAYDLFKVKIGIETSNPSCKSKT